MIVKNKGEDVRRGFVTIATGNEKYYKLAFNLLCSYRLHCVDDRIPFAIICDEENIYTKAFDHVVLMDNSQKSFMDKLYLFKYSPYDETIFIDADSLFLNSPEKLWIDFADMDDVSCYGAALPLDSDKGWFSYEGSGKYKDRLEFLVSLHGGLYYFRKTARAQKIFELAIKLAEEYCEYGFLFFEKPADEPVIAMAMAVFHCLPNENKPNGGILFIPACRVKVKITLHGQILVEKKKAREVLCHFGTPNTELFLYQYLVFFNESKYQDKKYNKIISYVKIRVLTAPKACKAFFTHKMGYIARTLLPDRVFNKIKNELL